MDARASMNSYDLTYQGSKNNQTAVEKYDQIFLDFPGPGNKESYLKLYIKDSVLYRYSFIYIASFGQLFLYNNN